LAASLQGQGSLRIRDASLGQIEPVPVLAAADVPGRALRLARRRYAVAARFELGEGRARLDQLLLSRPGEEIEITGSVDFTRRLDLRVHPLSPAASGAQVAGAPAVWIVGGTLDAPRVTPEAVAGNRDSVLLVAP
jgi:hypothetical protein